MLHTYHWIDWLMLDTFARVTHDVLIAGAGPAGLFLAGELRLAGASVLVLEREVDPRSVLKQLPFGLRGLSAPTVQAFDRRGLLTELEALSPAARPGRQAGHFAGIPIADDDVDTARWWYRLPSPAGTHLASTMEHVETVLAERAVAMGAEIVRGCGVDGLEQSADGVVVRAGDRSFRARWLVGCDGGRSVVRKVGGFDVVGTQPRFTGYSVQVELTDPESLPLGRHYTPAGVYIQSEPGTFAVADFDGGVAHRGLPVTRERVQDVLRRATGVDVTVTALGLATTWTDRAQQATAYRRGRVLLAGDAAHVHSPLGGQGLNLGIGDAANLGWKLGAVLRGAASVDLLDTYFRERHPVGAAVLDWSRAQVALMEPDAGARALAGIVGDLIATRDGATYFAERKWAVSLRYDLPGQHPLVGRSVPDVRWADGTRLNELLRDGRGVLLNFDGHDGVRALGRRSGAHLNHVENEVEDRLGCSALLVRPDGIVAWSCDGEPDLAEITTALSQWISAVERPSPRTSAAAPAAAVTTAEAATSTVAAE